MLVNDVYILAIGEVLRTKRVAMFNDKNVRAMLEHDVAALFIRLQKGTLCSFTYVMSIQFIAKYMP